MQLVPSIQQHTQTTGSVTVQQPRHYRAQSIMISTCTQHITQASLTTASGTGWSDMQGDPQGSGGAGTCIYSTKTGSYTGGEYTRWVFSQTEQAVSGSMSIYKQYRRVAGVRVHYGFGTPIDRGAEIHTEQCVNKHIHT